MNRRHLLGFSALALTLRPTALRAQDPDKGWVKADMTPP